MKIVFLDSATLGDVSLEPISRLGELVCYPFTTPGEVPARVADADVIITNKVVIDDACARILAQGSKIWVNTIWASLCGGDGNDDDAAYQAGDPGEVYRQYLDKGVSIIQTDRPELLIGWLDSVGRHTLK